MDNLKEHFTNATEERKPVAGKITGSLPEWLKGDLIRVGPGIFDVKDFTYNHWFDGLAIVYKFSIRNGEVTFMKRFVESDAYTKTTKHGKPVFTEFGTKAHADPSKGFFSRMISSFDPSSVTDNGCINVVKVGKELFVATESCYLRRIEQDSLETKEKVDLAKIAGVNFTCSHVITDTDGTTYNVGTALSSGGPKYNIMKTFGNAGKGKDVWQTTKILVTIPSSWKASYSYLHSFALTPNYLIFMELPILINSFKLATANVKGKSLHECTEWHPKELVKIHLIKKDTGELLKTKYITDTAFFCLHHVNAYEVNDQIVMDLIIYPDMDIMDKLYLEKVRSTNTMADGCTPKVVRFVIPVHERIQDVTIDKELVNIPNCKSSAKRVQDNQKGEHIKLSHMDIGEPGFDMPVINALHVGQSYRYIYGNGGWDQGHYRKSICKVDVETGETKLWKESEFHYPAEPTLIIRPNATSEDDGVLLVPLCDARKGQSHYMVIIDAKTLNEIARIEVQSSIPNALHGIFVPDE